MSAAGGGAAGAAAAAAAIANAIKASGAIVRVAPPDFKTILNRQDKPLVVQSTGGVFTTKYRYLSSYKGLAFFTESRKSLHLPGEAEVIIADRIWLPG